MQSTTARWRITHGIWCTCQMGRRQYSASGWQKSRRMRKESHQFTRAGWWQRGFSRKRRKITKKCLPQLLSLQRYVCCWR
ncbi:hypothetical protein CLOM_g10679 [Closterium sp. NIES-68]|nr:hypothetical protein CLOM_g10679 [Closterium sp. NIES-68]